MHDGQVKRISIPEEIEVGMIVRETHGDGTVPPFADHVVLRRGVISIRNGDKVSHDTEFDLARPYAFGSSLGTTCPTPLLGCETLKEVRFGSLRDRFVLVLDSRGVPFKYET